MLLPPFLLLPFNFVSYLISFSHHHQSASYQIQRITTSRHLCHPTLTNSQNSLCHFSTNVFLNSQRNAATASSSRPRDLQSVTRYGKKRKKRTKNCIRKFTFFCSPVPVPRHLPQDLQLQQPLRLQAGGEGAALHILLLQSGKES